MADRLFGDIQGIPVGTTFRDRKSLAEAGVHRPLQAGISGAGQEGADSVVVSGGYEDDQDRGDEIVYTGHGGNDPSSGNQIADQTLTRGNLALFTNRLRGLAVRVIRGAYGESSYAPSAGFRYDGLCYVADAWPDQGKSGYTIWRFKLVREPSAPPLQVTIQAPAGNLTPGSKAINTLRMIRNTTVATWLRRGTSSAVRCAANASRLQVGHMRRVLIFVRLVSLTTGRTHRTMCSVCARITMPCSISTSSRLPATCPSWDCRGRLQPLWGIKSGLTTLHITTRDLIEPGQGAHGIERVSDALMASRLHGTPSQTASGSVKGRMSHGR
jgi:hypothetical protein